ncbi:ankyrin repeat domain-containing protein [Serratia marcescens]|uniref:ankyrin repeat domain-containing protein n=1 Tax=Serratia marcescens TaxID=615 RepID=UPI0009264D61|nr:ankyrin repeat domain-containing protein [Serratia marcescens]OJH81899.1 ankyrin repeat protein [Serratia marcescens]
MKRMLMALTLILTTFMIQGCKKDMDYKPQNFFEGKQLEIAQLIYDGNESGLKQALSGISKEDMNRPAKAEMTLLFWAVLNSIYDRNSNPRLRIITDLVNAGADPLQPRTEGGSSPAEYVLKADSGIWIKAMLDGGLSPNSKDRVFNEPLIFETRKAKNTETLKVMIERGANINIRDSLKQTLVMAAFFRSSFGHVELLLNSGADPNPVDINNLSLLTVVKRQIKDTKEGSEYNNECKKILALMLAKGAK